MSGDSVKSAVRVEVYDVPDTGKLVTNLGWPHNVKAIRSASPYGEPPA